MSLKPWEDYLPDILEQEYGQTDDSAVGQAKTAVPCNQQHQDLMPDHLMQQCTGGGHKWVMYRQAKIAI